MKAKDWPRLALTAAIMLMLGYVVVAHYSPAVEQVVIALAMLAAGYWLGSSKGSSDKMELIEAQRGDQAPIVGERP